MARHLRKEQVLEIRARYAAGESLESLGVAFDRTAMSIWNVVTRRTWADVTSEVDAKTTLSKDSKMILNPIVTVRLRETPEGHQVVVEAYGENSERTEIVFTSPTSTAITADVFRQARDAFDYIHANGFEAALAYFNIEEDLS